MFSSVNCIQCDVQCVRMTVLQELPMISQEEHISLWLDSQDNQLQNLDNYKCDCFQPDNVHYACTDVTVKTFLSVQKEH